MATLVNADDASPPAAFTLSVLVEDDTGAPLPGASIELVRNGWIGGYCGFPLHRDGKDPPMTGAEGRIHVTGLDGALPHGERYYLAVTHPDFAEALVDRPERLPREDGEARVHVRLDRGHTLSGVVRGPGTGAEIMAVLENRNVPGCYAVIRRATCDADGRFELTGLRRGEHEIRATAPGMAGAVSTARVPDERAVDLTLTTAVAPTPDVRAPGVWTGSVVDEETGEPLPRAIGIFASRGHPDLLHGGGEADDGRFTLSLPEGRYTLAFLAWGERDSEWFARLDGVEIASGEAREGVVVRAARAFAASVRVIDAATDTPIEGAYVIVNPPFVWCRFWPGNTGADGIYRVDPAFAGPVRITVDAPGYARVTFDRPLTRGMDPIEVRLARGA